MYWRYGGLPFDKMKEQIARDTRRLVKDQVREILPELLTKHFIETGQSPPLDHIIATAQKAAREEILSLLARGESNREVA